MDDTRTSALIARQPIYSVALEVTAYELLFRPLAGGQLSEEAGTQATARLIADTLMEQGIRPLTGGHPAFVNFTRELVTGGFATLLPRDSIAIEVLEDVPADPEVLSALGELRHSGYVVALDDVVSADRLRDFHGLVDVVKVDLPFVEPERLGPLLRDLRRLAPRARIVAEKVESWEDFQVAKQLGFDGFQGYFLSKPLLIEHRSFTGFKPHYLRLLEATTRPEVDLGEVERIVRGDLSLTNKLLRRANSAEYMRVRQLTSLREALVLLGTEGVRRAAALLALSGLGGDRPTQLTIDSVLRARFCEALADHGRVDASHLDLFLAGMFSMSDAILGLPMHELVEELPVPVSVRAALSSREGQLGGVLELVEAYERAHWDDFHERAERIGLNERAVGALYVEAAGWAREVFETTRAA